MVIYHNIDVDPFENVVLGAPKYDKVHRFCVTISPQTSEAVPEVACFPT